MTQKKWTHLQDGLNWIWSVAQTTYVVSTVELQRWVGVAVHVTEVYADARPYLKGVINAMEMFLEWRSRWVATPPSCGISGSAGDSRGLPDC